MKFFVTKHFFLSGHFSVQSIRISAQLSCKFSSYFGAYFLQMYRSDEIRIFATFFEDDFYCQTEQQHGIVESADFGKEL